MIISGIACRKPATEGAVCRIAEQPRDPGLLAQADSMAHKPFWFHPELNDKDQVFNLVPMIQRGKAPIALTSAFTH